MRSESIAIATAGVPIKAARAGVILLHGRGASAEDILTLAHELDQDDLAYLAPQAPGYAAPAGPDAVK